MQKTFLWEVTLLRHGFTTAIFHNFRLGKISIYLPLEQLNYQLKMIHVKVFRGYVQSRWYLEPKPNGTLLRSILFRAILQICCFPIPAHRMPRLGDQYCMSIGEWLFFLSLTRCLYYFFLSRASAVVFSPVVFIVPFVRHLVTLSLYCSTIAEPGLAFFVVFQLTWSFCYLKVSFSDFFR